MVLVVVSPSLILLTQASPETPILRPNAPGTYTEWTTVYPAGISHWDAVDDVTADDAGSYIETATKGHRDTFNLPDIPSGASVSTVKVYARNMRVDPSAKLYIMIRTYGTDYVSPSMNAATTWTTYSYEWATNPYTGANWTAEEVNALEAGLQTCEATKRVRVTQVYVEVTYTLPPPPDTTPPAWSNTGTNNTIAGEPTLFHVKWTDNVGLSGFIFGTNNTGTWVNDTWTLISGTTNWSNITKILNSNVGVVVKWRVWANDTSNNWNDTGTLSLTTASHGVNPVASFTYSPVNPYRYETVTFNASASYDSDGSIVSYKWDFGDGNVTTVTDPIITHFYVKCGNYTVTLTVTDNESLTNSTSAIVTVLNPDLLRLWADAGSYVGSHPDAWILESWVVSTDVPPGSSVSFNLYIDAKSNPAMMDPTYDIYLAVAVNDTAQVASITIGPTTITTFTYGEVTWPDAAGGGTLPRHGVYPTWYALALFGDVDSNHGYYTTPGDPYGPYWAFRANISVTITTSATMNAGFKVHFDAQGTLVRGSTDPRDRNSNPFSHDLTFKGALYVLIPPVACFTVSNDSPNVCETVTFNASCSYDPDDVIVKYEWDWEGDCVYDFDAGNNPIAYYHYDTYGYYYPKLRVTDNDGLTDETNTTIHVRQHPVANFTWSPFSPQVGELVTFNGSLSTPDGGTIISYTWDFGDGNITTVSDPIITHVYSNNGTFTVILNVTDSEGKWDTESKSITVKAKKYYLTVKTDPAGIVTIPGEDWYDNCTYVTLTAPTPVSVSPGVQYRFDYWDVDGANVSGNPIIVHMDANHTATAHYVKQYRLIMSTNFGTTSPSVGQHWYDAGSVVPISATAPSVVDGERYVWLGWTGTGTISYTGMDNPASVTMNSPVNETAAWRHEYRLTMATNYGTTTPTVGQHWYTAGQGVSIQAFAPSLVYPGQEQYVWNGWTGTGTISYTGMDNPATVTMNSPITQTASWTRQFLLTIKTSGLPSAYPTKVYLGGSQVGTASDVSPYTKWFDSGTPTGTIGVDSTVSGATGTRYVFVKWVEDDSTNNPRASETMNSPKTYTAKYKTQYLLVVRTDPAGLNPQPTRNPAGEAGPAGSWWYDNSTNVLLTAQPVTGYTFLNWDVEGTSVPGNPIGVHMNMPLTATAHYEKVVKPVGGVIISINKIEPPTPWVVLASTILSTLVMVVVLTKRRIRKAL